MTKIRAITEAAAKQTVRNDPDRCELGYSTNGIKTRWYIYYWY